MAPNWGGMDPELEAIFNDGEPDQVELPRKKVPNGDVYEASRAGDVERLRWLLDLGVNVNARDAWDSVALYYACLAGHLDVALMLLEYGATCSENTFDGDRCHYAALNLRIRKLLKAYESRPPPLSPLAASLRELFTSSYSNLAYLERNFSNSSGRSAGSYVKTSETGGTSSSGYEEPDVIFYVGGRGIQAHRAVLAARSPFFKRKFGTDWRNRREFRFSSRKLSFSALFSLIHFFYTDRLDVAVDDMEDLVRVCKVCECVALQKALEKELFHQRYATYKAVKKVEEIDDSQKRFVLLGSSLPWEEQLHANLRRLFRLTLRNSARENSELEKQTTPAPKHLEIEELGSERIRANGHARSSHVIETVEGGKSPQAVDQTMQRLSADSSDTCSVGSDTQLIEEDHADVLFLVAGEKFRCHKAILATRSEYFKARFFRALGLESESFGESLNTEKKFIGTTLPILEEHELGASAFTKLLEYIYTDFVEELHPDDAEEMFDAASRYLLFPLKRALVDVLLPQIESTPTAELCSWLLMADMYGVWKLREYCLDVMALNFEAFAATPEFRRMLYTLPPPSGDDTARTSAPSAPGEVERADPGNLLDDLREKWLAIEGEELDKRDASAVEFDQRLAQLVEWAILEESERDADHSATRNSDP